MRPYHPELKAAGYDYDACNADVLLNKMTVQDGRLTLPSGMSYRVLVLPNVPFMTPQLLAKVRALVEQGAVVVGPKPLRSPSLQEYPKCDEDVRRMADEVWGDCDGRMVKEHAFGKGRVIWGERKVLGPPPPAQWPAGSVEPVLVELRTPPDCSFTWVDANVRAAVSRPGGEGDRAAENGVDSSPDRRLRCLLHLESAAGAGGHRLQLPHRRRAARDLARGHRPARAGARLVRRRREDGRPDSLRSGRVGVRRLPPRRGAAAACRRSGSSGLVQSGALGAPWNRAGGTGQQRTGACAAPADRDSPKRCMRPSMAPAAPT